MDRGLTEMRKGTSGTGTVRTEEVKCLSGWAWGSHVVGGALVIAASSISLLICCRADALDEPEPVMELIRMKPSSQTSKPNETASSDLSPKQKHSSKKPEVTKPTRDASESRRPTETTPAAPETDEGEDVLVRELDGRYRIIGRRPRDPK